MRPSDVRKAAEVVASDSVVAARYGRFLPDLPSAWLRVLRSEALRAMVIE